MMKNFVIDTLQGLSFLYRFFFFNFKLLFFTQAFGFAHLTIVYDISINLNVVTQL